MNEEFFQLWAEIPYFGRQWVGWIKGQRLNVVALSLALKGCPGVQYTVLDSQGNPLAPAWQLPGGWQFPQWG